MKTKIKLISLVFIVIGLGTWAYLKPNSTNVKKNLPAQVISSDLPSAELAVEKIWVTESYPSSDPQHFATGIENVTVIEKKAIRKFIEDNSNGAIYIVRFEITDPEFIELTQLALAKGMTITYIVDLNLALINESDSNLQESDFEKLSFNKSEMSDVIYNLLQLGCRFKSGICRILSQPVYKRVDGDMISNLHEKALILVSNEGQSNEQIEFYSGSANFTYLAQVNTLFKINDELAKKYYLRVIHSMISNYEENGSIADLEKIQPLRIQYADDSFMELASTLGRYDINTRIQDVFIKAAKEPSFEIEDVYLNHNAITHRGVVNAMVDAMKSDSNFRIHGIVDDKFTTQDSPGLAAILSGWDVFRSFGGPVAGYGEKISSRVNFYAYQAPGKNLLSGKDLVLTDKEKKYEQQKMFHNKSSVIFVKENNKHWAYVFMGSYNLSGHFENSEFQIMFKVPRESFIAQHIRWDFEGIIKTQDSFAIPISRAIVRNFIADFCDQAVLSISNADIDFVNSAVLQDRFSDLLKELQNIYNRKSTIEKRKTLKEFKEKVNRLEKFFVWFAEKQISSSDSPEEKLRRTVSILFVENHLDLGSRNLEFALKSYFKNSKGHKQIALINESWKILGFPGDPPVLKAKNRK